MSGFNVFTFSGIIGLMFGVAAYLYGRKMEGGNGRILQKFGFCSVWTSVVLLVLVLKGYELMGVLTLSTGLFFSVYGSWCLLFTKVYPERRKFFYVVILGGLLSVILQIIRMSIYGHAE